MNVITFDTPEQQAKGLQYLPEIPANVLYVFPLVDPGTYFHSWNVAEPFDIAFLAEDFTVLSIGQITPPKDGMTAPPATAMVVEAKAGVLRAAEFELGQITRF